MTKLKLILRRRWPILLAGALIGALASLFVQVGDADEAPTRWKASQVVFLDLTQTPSGAGTTVIAQGSVLMTQGRVPEAAAELLGFEGDPADLAAKITAAPETESLSILITTTDPDPDVAVERVSAFSDAFITVVSEQSLADRQQAVVDAQSGFDSAAQALAQFDSQNPGVANLLPTNAVETQLVETRKQLIDAFADAEAELTTAENALNQGALYFTQGPDKPTRVAVSSLKVPTSRWFNLAVLTTLGLALGAALAAIIERISPRIDTKDDIIAEFDFPVVGEVMKLRRMHRQGRSRTEVTLDLPSAEAYRRIRSVFRFAINRNAEARRSTEPDPRRRSSTVFMVVSALPDEGKSTSVAMTALAMGEAGVPTLAVGCDYRRPTIDTLLGIPGSVGITSRAEMSIDRPELADIVFHTSHDNLWIAPSGPSTTNVAGCADIAREIVSAARSEGLSVIIDTTPMLLANDAAELLDVVDEIILVVRSGRTPVKSVQQVVDQLDQQGRRLLGAVLIGSPELKRMQYYYSDYYSDDSPTRAPAASSEPPSASIASAATPVDGNGAAPLPSPPSEALR